jgi:hypothetical protein
MKTATERPSETRVECDPISADARYIAECARKDANFIVKTLWGIFVLLPIVLIFLYALTK